MEPMFSRDLSSPIGSIRLLANDDALLEVRLPTQRASGGGGTTRSHSPTHPILDRVEEQLGAYFSGRLRSFEVPLAPSGTPFQQEVWQTLLTIPFGECRSYGWLAGRIGRPRAARAVGAANGCNPLPIIVPCHRVIGADGSLTGYGGGLDTKRRLLEHEGVLAPRLAQL